MGSLLWIHGKRACFPFFILAVLMETRLYSGVWKDRPFVRTIPFPPFR